MSTELAAELTDELTELAAELTDELTELTELDTLEVRVVDTLEEYDTDELVVTLTVTDEEEFSCSS